MECYSDTKGDLCVSATEAEKWTGSKKREINLPQKRGQIEKAGLLGTRPCSPKHGGFSLQESP